MNPKLVLSFLLILVLFLLVIIIKDYVLYGFWSALRDVLCNILGFSLGSIITIVVKLVKDRKRDQEEEQDEQDKGVS